MRQRCLRYCQILFLPLFLIHIVCQRRLCDVMPYAPSIVRITITLMFHSFFFNSLVRSKYLFYFHSVVRQNDKIHKMPNFLFCLGRSVSRFGLLARIKWSICISKSQGIYCILISWTDSGLWIYHLILLLLLLIGISTWNHITVYKLLVLKHLKPCHWLKIIDMTACK